MCWSRKPFKTQMRVNPEGWDGGSCGLDNQALISIKTCLSDVFICFAAVVGQLTKQSKE